MKRYFPFKSWPPSWKICPSMSQDDSVYAFFNLHEMALFFVLTSMADATGRVTVSGSKLAKLSKMSLKSLQRHLPGMLEKSGSHILRTGISSKQSTTYQIGSVEHAHGAISSHPTDYRTEVQQTMAKETVVTVAMVQETMVYGTSVEKSQPGSGEFADALLSKDEGNLARAYLDKEVLTCGSPVQGFCLRQLSEFLRSRGVIEHDRGALNYFDWLLNQGCASTYESFMDPINQESFLQSLGDKNQSTHDWKPSLSQQITSK